MEHSTVFICYGTCTDEGWNTVAMEMRGGTQYNICYGDEGWNTVQYLLWR